MNVTLYFNFYCKRNGIPLSATLFYLKILFSIFLMMTVLRSKHVAIV